MATEEKYELRGLRQALRQFQNSDAEGVQSASWLIQRGNEDEQDNYWTLYYREHSEDYERDVAVMRCKENGILEPTPSIVSKDFERIADVVSEEYEDCASLRRAVREELAVPLNKTCVSMDLPSIQVNTELREATLWGATCIAKGKDEKFGREFGDTPAGKQMTKERLKKLRPLKKLADKMEVSYFAHKGKLYQLTEVDIVLPEKVSDRASARSFAKGLAGQLGRGR